MSEEIPEAARTITRDLAEEWGLLDGGVEKLHHERLEEHRWYAVHLIVFRAPDDGQTYGATYLRGHTESQEQDPWDDETEIVLTRMEPHPKTITVWLAIDEDPDDDGAPPVDRDALARAGQVAHWTASGLTPPPDLGDERDAWRAAATAITSLAAGDAAVQRPQPGSDLAGALDQYRNERDEALALACDTADRDEYQLIVREMLDWFWEPPGHDNVGADTKARVDDWRTRAGLDPS